MLARRDQPCDIHMPLRKPAEVFLGLCDHHRPRGAWPTEFLCSCLRILATLCIEGRWIRSMTIESPKRETIDQNV